MSKPSLLAQSDVEIAALTTDATDESLILAAKELTASYNGHLRRSIEDFWRLGETLTHLFERRHLNGRWADVLAEIGINITTDNHARRLFQATTIDGLSEFRNKTAALRAFGILSTPTVKVQAVSSPEVGQGESNNITESPRKEQLASEPQNGAEADLLAKGERPERRISPSRVRRVAEAALVSSGAEGVETSPGLGRETSKESDESLEILAKIAARLEYLAADEVPITGDHLAQIDRMVRALDVIRSKGVVDAA